MTAVLIVGGGKVGSHLARLLQESQHSVTVVEIDSDHATRLVGRLGAGTVVHGSGTDARVLERAGIRNVDVLAAVTGADETNLVVAGLGRFEFGVNRVIARVVDPRNAWLFGPDMGVDAALDQTDMLAHLVLEEISMGDMTLLLKLRRGQFSLVGEVVAEDSPAVGWTVAELGLPEECAVVAILREGELLPGHRQVAVRPGDEILAVVHEGAAADLARLLESRGDPPPPS